MVAGAIDRFNAEQPVCGIVVDGEFVLRQIAQHDMAVAARRQADHLQLHVADIGPEPRHRRIGVRMADDGARGKARLVGRVLHRFQPHVATGEPVPVRGGVADGEDFRH
jgi:hypothetical protein